MKKYVFFCLFCFSFPAAITAQKKRPNIIVILADDMGYSDIGIFGSEIKTPNIDLLGQKGVVFNQF
jgi:arylsulfatase